MVTIGAKSHAKLQSNRHHQQTNNRLFTGRMPFLSPNQVSEDWRKIVFILDNWKHKERGNNETVYSNLCAAASTISLDMVCSRWLRCSENTSSGQWRSLTNVCRASSFQRMSSDVAQPFLLHHHSQWLTHTGSLLSFGLNSFDLCLAAPVRCGFLLVCYIVTLYLRCTVFEIFDFKNAVTLLTGLGVRQGHWKCHHSTERIWRPIEVL